MITKIILSLFVLMMWGKIYSQNDLPGYLKSNAYPLTLDQPMPEKINTLFHKIAGESKIILLGESGSHFLKFYSPLGATIITNLNRTAGLKTFVIEGGSATAYLCNKYLDTGDTGYLPRFSQERSFIFWKLIYQYNQTLSSENRLKVIGIDFESPISYFKALNDLLPNEQAPEEIAREVSLIRISTQPVNCDELSRIDKLLKRSLKQNLQTWQNYAGPSRFNDLYTIISNEGSCKDALANRNKNLRNRFLAFDAKLQEPVYYGQFGQAHTSLDSKWHFAALLNNDPGSRFHNKVSVINTYCHNCKTGVEPVSNWVLKKIDKDIRDELIPFTQADFTLFDFSGSPSLTGKYLRYGQFLLIVKDQQ